MSATPLASTAVPFWTLSADAQCKALGSGQDGLTTAEAEARLKRCGENADARRRRANPVYAVLRRLLEPLSQILLAAGIVSIATGDRIGGAIIVAILVFSIALNTFQEGHAEQAAEMLRRSVALKAEVKRDGAYAQVPVETVVPGDLIRVRAGDIIPADALVLSASACTANEAALTGEPYPVEKRPGAVTGTTAAQATDGLFRGAVIQTGEAEALVVATGPATLFGAAATALVQAEVASPFQRDLRAYGLLTARLTLALVVVVLAINIFFGRPLLQSLLFAVALAVGLTPELLPMITTVTLSRGAVRMAKRKVIVKRLASIHDLGAMTIFCTDKTGTLTSAEIKLARSMDAGGGDDPRASRLGAIAATLGGDRGAMDAALIAGVTDAANGWTSLQRRAFDFTRRLGSVLARGPEGDLLIVKGAPEAVLALCAASRAADATAAMDDGARSAALAQVRSLAEAGQRAVAVASRAWSGEPHELVDADEVDFYSRDFARLKTRPSPLRRPRSRGWRRPEYG